MDDFEKLNGFLLSNNFEPSQIAAMSFSRGAIMVDIIERTRTITIPKKDDRQGVLIEEEPHLETYHVGKIQIVDLMGEKEGLPYATLYFNPYNLNDFMLKYTVINGDMDCEFKMQKKLDAVPTISVTSKLIYDLNILNYFLSNLHV